MNTAGWEMEMGQVIVMTLELLHLDMKITAALEISRLLNLKTKLLPRDN